MSTIFKGDDAEKCYAKGHFVVYTVDHKRFVLPLVYLSNNVVQALMELAEEFGLPTMVLSQFFVILPSWSM